MATSPNYRSGSRRGGQYRSGQGRDVYRQERNGYVYGNLAHQLEEIPERRKQPGRKGEQRHIRSQSRWRCRPLDFHPLYF